MKKNEDWCLKNGKYMMKSYIYPYESLFYCRFD